MLGTQSLGWEEPTGTPGASSGPGAVRGHIVRCSGTSPRTLIWPQVAEGVTPTTHIFSGDWESQEEPPRSVEVARSAFGAEDGVDATDGEESREETGEELMLGTQSLGWEEPTGTPGASSGPEAVRGHFVRLL